VKRATSRATGTSTTSAKRTTTKTAKSTKAAAKKPRAKKAAPKKAATKKKPKKVTLTEEQKAAQKAKLLKRKTSEKKKADLLEIKTLKEQALAPPVPVTGNRNAYNVYVAEAMKGAKGSNGDVTSAFAHVAKQYKSLSAAEKEVRKRIEGRLAVQWRSLLTRENRPTRSAQPSSRRCASSLSRNGLRVTAPPKLALRTRLELVLTDFTPLEKDRARNTLLFPTNDCPRDP
jgi:hypothetical protein